jgi:hypothetical protein
MSDQVPNDDPIRSSSVLEGKIADLRSRIMKVAFGTGATLTVTAFIGLLGAEMLVDWNLELPWALRFIWFLGSLAAVVYLVNENIILPLLDAPDTDRTALIVERHFPKFKSRLISTLQLTRPGGLHGNEASFLVKALVRQTEDEAQEVDFGALVRTDRLRRNTVWLLGSIGVAGLLYGLGGLASSALLQRAFLSTSVEVPRKTQVAEFTGDLTIGRGDPVILTAAATGVIPGTGTVSVSFESGRERDFPMEKAEGAATYTRKLESVQESFSYVVRLNDGRSKVGRVNVVPRPTVAKIEARQTFPAYTGLGEAKRSLADLSLLSGSRLRLNITANKQVSAGFIQLYGVTNRYPLQVGTGNPLELVASVDIPATNLTGFSIQMSDLHGLQSRDEAIYRIDVLPDRLPQVSITHPVRREELVTQKARMLIAFEALDDFGVASVQLRYQIDGGKTNVTDLVLGKRTDRQVKRRYDWRIGEFEPPVPEGAAIEYWIDVRDNNDITGPGISQSERYVARIVTEEAKRQDLMNRVGDSLSSIGEATTDQETLNRRLGELIKSRVEEPEQP